jgi:hypothetical protein
LRARRQAFRRCSRQKTVHYRRRRKGTKDTLHHGIVNLPAKTVLHRSRLPHDFGRQLSQASLERGDMHRIDASGCAHRRLDAPFFLRADRKLRLRRARGNQFFQLDFCRAGRRVSV